MPRASAGTTSLPFGQDHPADIKPGVLVECDASIKAIIVKINSENQNIYIIEDIDDEHVLIQASKHDELKARLNAVCSDSRTTLHLSHPIRN